MNTLFPFGFPGPTALYLTLYVVTLVSHVIFMNYVVAGTGYLAASSLGSSPNKGPAARLLGDWLTVGLSVAITAGVAPLLFIQILYKEAFYSANLLLFHRWMLILPVLIVGFYLLYLQKSDKISQGPAWLRRLVGPAALLCFLFVGYSWTENHLLSQQPAVWPEFYSQGKLFYYSNVLLPRLGIWITGALPTMSMLVGWQLLWQRRHEGVDLKAHTVDDRRLAIVALVGLALSAGCGAWSFALLPQSATDAMTGALGLPWLIAALVGGVAQVAAWAMIARKGAIERHTLWLASAGSGLAITGATVAREAVRLSQNDMVALAQHHAKALEQGGLILFLIFFAVNAAIIGWIVRVGHLAAQKRAQASNGPQAA